MTYVTAKPCVDVKDRSCVEECPVDWIYEGARMPYVQLDECVDYRVCEPVCSVEAIFYEDDLPQRWAGFAAINAEFFSELGSPGGAAKTGPPPFDQPRISALPHSTANDQRWRFARRVLRSGEHHIGHR
ncbi:ferredoxin [[Mycobacterium] kokjensenii]|uniref:ferredoxin n=1 Tax=[Mycobacterium] kokjensenii TaxID=3064287 RepID=UPI00280609FA|nr:ferredoxin [Mycolicibacter sp. MU0083]